MYFLLPALLIFTQAFARGEPRGEHGMEHRETPQHHSQYNQNNFHRNYENPVIIQGGQQQPVVIPSQDSADQIYQQNQGQ